MNFILLLLGFINAMAEPLPTELEEWQEWVTSDQTEKDCAISKTGRHCNWLGSISLSLRDDGANFKMMGRLDKDQLTPIVGGKGAWPINVRGNGKMIPIVDVNGRPHALLMSGEHMLEGEISWPTMPNRLPLPQNAGIVSLKINGESTPTPKFNPKTGLEISAATNDQNAQDAISLIVIRKINDGVPMVIESRFTLEVSGSARVVNLGKLELKGAESRGLSSIWPAWRNDKGETLVSVEAGVGQLESTSVIGEPTLELQGHERDNAEIEYWSFVKDDTVRLVELASNHAIDPQQTPTPEEWKTHPTFAIGTNQTLEITEIRRGQPTPPPDAISLHRNIWLNFAGNRLTILDKFRGELNQTWRLNALDDLALGSASLEGKPIVITNSREQGRGIELRSGALDLNAVSQWNDPENLSSISWDAPVDHLSASLHLPPGWALISASGPDAVSGSLKSKWNIGLLFIALLITAIVGKKRGILQGSLVMAAVALAGADLGFGLAPLLISTVLILALENADNWKTVWVRRIIAGITAVYVSICAWNLLDKAMDPSRYHQHSNTVEETANDLKPSIIPSSGYRMKSIKPNDNPDDIRETGQVAQTGPGIPTWSGDSIRLYWTGAQQNAHLQFYFLTPAQRAIMLIASALLLCISFWLFLGLRLPKAGAPLFALGLACMTPSANAEIPDATLRAELKERLSQPTLCGQHCTATPLFSIAISENQLAIRAEVHTLQDSVWALPGPLSRWSPTSITLDGNPVENLRRNENGYLEMRLPAGIWDIEAKGPIKAPLPLTFEQRAQQIHFNATGYSVEGIDQDNTHDKVITIRKEGDAETSVSDIPALRLKRELHLGQTWTILNSLTRLNANTGRQTLSIPLAAGENILSSQHKVENGHVVVHLESNQSSVSWKSKIPQSEGLELRAANTTEWAEEWQLHCAVKYRCTAQGLPPITHIAEAKWRPTWRPWPGEGMRVDVELLKPVDGETLTLDALRINRRKRNKMWEDHVSIKHRASQSGILTLTLPADSEVVSIHQANVALPISVQNGNLELPYGLGKGETVIKWRTPVVQGALFSSPEMSLSSPPTNVSVGLDLGRDSIILWSAQMGRSNAFRLPHLLLVGLALALLLARLPMSPIRFRQWLILGFGLSQIPIFISIWVPIWVLFSGYLQKEDTIGPGRTLLHLIGGGITALILAGTVISGLLFEPSIGYPDAYKMNWFLDETGETVPMGSVLTMPTWVWRGLMLMWSLWIGMIASRWFLSIKWPGRLQTQANLENESTPNQIK